MSDYLEPLETIFQRVERDFERCAKEECDRDEIRSLSSSTSSRSKRRRRGSISITRIGQVPDDTLKSSRDLFTNKRISTIVEESPFYQGRMTNDSVNTFSSEGDAPEDAEENDHTTQVRITGAKSISRAMQVFLPRQLTRSRSVSVVASRDANMVIGVSVEKATVESETGDEPRRASVHLGRTVRKQPSTLSMSASSPAAKGWVAKAKDFTQRLRRRRCFSGPANTIPP